MSNKSAEPISDVGSERANEKTTSDDPGTSQWRMMFEMQNEQMRALIQAINTQRPTNHVTLPEFDPEKRDAVSQSWCATANLCLSDNPLEGRQLIVALSKALKGTASTWLSQVTYPGITWQQFKKHPTPSTSQERANQQSAPKGTLVCFKCGKPGHIAARCVSAAPGASAAGAVPRAKRPRQVDLCVVEPSSGLLTHNGRSITFYFDSGAECSLVKESFARKLSGKRFNSVVSLIDIGNKNVNSTE